MFFYLLQQKDNHSEIQFNETFFCLLCGFRSPYSDFKVGAAIRLSNGKISTGCNIENSSFSPSICAERTAASKAISDGHREFKAIAVVAYQENSFTTPCGVCRQFLAEFAPKDIPVYVAKPAPHQVLVTTIGELLPMGFVPVDTPKNLILG